MTRRAGGRIGWYRPVGGRYLCLPMGLLNQRRRRALRGLLPPLRLLASLPSEKQSAVLPGLWFPAGVLGRRVRRGASPVGWRRQRLVHPGARGEASTQGERQQRQSGPGFQAEPLEELAAKERPAATRFGPGVGRKYPPAREQLGVADRHPGRAGVGRSRWAAIPYTGRPGGSPPMPAIPSGCNSQAGCTDSSSV